MVINESPRGANLCRFVPVQSSQTRALGGRICTCMFWSFEVSRADRCGFGQVCRISCDHCQGQMLAVWILAAKLPNSDVNFAVDVWVDFFFVFILCIFFVFF